MSQRPNILPDPFEFARRGARVEAEVDAARLERLQDVLKAGSGEQIVHYSVSGRRAGDKLFLDIAAQGELFLECQRCLEAMACSLSIEASLMLVAEDESLPDDGLEDDSFDPVHAGRDFDVLAAVEDELLLALPISPMHAQACAAQGAQAADSKPSPFAALAALKRKE